MTLKELSQLYYLNREIEIDLARLHDLRRKLESPAIARMSKAPAKTAQNRNVERSFEQYEKKVEKLRAIIEGKRLDCLDERIRLEEYICTIPDSLTRQIFTLRFVNGLGWWQVAYSIGGQHTDESVRQHCHRYIKKSRNV